MILKVWILENGWTAHYKINKKLKMLEITRKLIALKEHSYKLVSLHSTEQLWLQIPQRNYSLFFGRLCLSQSQHVFHMQIKGCHTIKMKRPWVKPMVIWNAGFVGNTWKLQSTYSCSAKKLEQNRLLIFSLSLTPKMHVI